MRKKKLISNFYNITVNKKIPVFGGLGGGSSNAATVLKHWCKKKVCKIYKPFFKSLTFFKYYWLTSVLLNIPGSSAGALELEFNSVAA